MHAIALVLGFLAFGVALRLSGRLPASTAKLLSGWVINVALPAAAISSVHNVDPREDWWLAASMPWIGIVVAAAVVLPLCRAKGWSRQRAGALLLLTGWGSTAFVGLPMIEALAGQQWLSLGLVVDLFGSDLSLATVGIAVAAVAARGALRWRPAAMRVITFPPLLALLFALATDHLARPGWITGIVESLAVTLTPVALMAVGFQLRFNRIGERMGPLAVGLGVRLLVVPAAIALIYAVLGDLGHPVAKVAVLQMSMPAMVGAGIIAIEHDLEPDLVALVVGLGIPLSLLTGWAWWTAVGAA